MRKDFYFVCSAHHMKEKSNTPVYCLDDFGKKANAISFYIEKLSVHLQEHEFVSKPHKHDFYLMLYIQQGGGEHIIDFHSYPITKGVFFLMTPGQIHSWNMDANTEGYIIFFTKSIYQMQLSELGVMEFPFFHSLNANPLVKPSDKSIEPIITDLFEEFKRTNDVDKRILRTALDLVLLKLARCYTSSLPTSFHVEEIKLRKLESLIEKNFLKLKQPSDYADLMHLSPSYLNTLCKQNLNKTLSELIQERVLLEAKRLLAYTDFSVKEIADRLNFSTASYLIRYFKKHTGTTPDDFKESINRAI